MQTEEIKKFPKVELHCHLDGSLNEAALRKIVRESDYDIEGLLNSMKIRNEAAGLSDYLSRSEERRVGKE